MQTVNEVKLEGSVTWDINMTTLKNGIICGEFGLVTDRHYATDTTGIHSEPCYVSIEVYGVVAEQLRELKKCTHVKVKGQLKFRSWADKEAGKTVKRLTVVGEQVEMVACSDGLDEQKSKQDQIDEDPYGIKYDRENAEALAQWEEEDRAREEERRKVARRELKEYLKTGIRPPRNEGDDPWDQKSVYDNPYYDENADMDQQCSEFWNSL